MEKKNESNKWSVVNEHGLNQRILDNAVCAKVINGINGIGCQFTFNDGWSICMNLWDPSRVSVGQILDLKQIRVLVLENPNHPGVRVRSIFY